MDATWTKTFANATDEKPAVAPFTSKAKAHRAARASLAEVFANPESLGRVELWDVDPTTAPADAKPFFRYW